MLEKIVEKISSQKQISKSEVREKIESKIQELSGLISEEGAAYMVAKEMGIEIEKKNNITRIKDLAPNKDYEILAKAKNVYDPREFDTEKARGKVQNILLADETGSIQLTLWNEEIDKYDIEEGDVLKIRGFVKEDKTGQMQMNVGNYGIIEKVDENIVTEKKSGVSKREKISDLKTNQVSEIRAAIVQVFESKPFFEVCEKCGSSLKQGKCSEHGNVNGKKKMVINAALDDGSANIRAVFFAENAEKITGLKTEEAENMSNKEIYDSIKLVKDFILKGKCRLNNFFERNEFVINSLEEPEVEKEIKNLIDV